MNKGIISPTKKWTYVFLGLTMLLAQALAADVRKEMGRMTLGAVLSATKTETGWGLEIRGCGTASASQAQPFSLEFGPGAHPVATGYDSIEKKGGNGFA